MTEIDDGGPAFPQTIDDLGTMHSVTQGMSLRQWYAGQALAGMIQREEAWANAQYAATWAFEYADAMITEGKKG